MVDYSRWDNIEVSDDEEEESGYPGRMPSDFLEEETEDETDRDHLRRIYGDKSAAVASRFMKKARKLPPRWWPLRGHVRLHPEDTNVYSPTLFRENPLTFEAPDTEDLEPWGLASENDNDDPSGMRHYMHRMNYQNSSLLLFGKYVSPRAVGGDAPRKDIRWSFPGGRRRRLSFGFTPVFE